jgi:Asp-tRNA(Asn)/Glu-tRNA(Gln) amidotransferase A subunit family amidase
MPVGELKRFLNGETTVGTYRRRIAGGDAALHAFCQLVELEPTGDGSLRDVPFGVKDIFDAEGTRTEFGSPLHAGRVSASDSALVAMLRARGARVMGKTQTTAFAYFDPAPTVNPHDPAHTPGGSSSGSAAAVAAGMVPFALGSQTQGSVCRPASYCGVAGFKPSHGLLSLQGVMPFAPTLDTAGLFTQTAEDMRLLWERMGFPARSFDRVRLAAFPAPAEVETPMSEAFHRAVTLLGASWVEPPDSFRNLFPVVKLIQDTEGARTLESVYRVHGERVGTRLAAMIDRGLAVLDGEYRAALEALAAARTEMEQMFAQFDVILTPSALGPAPDTLLSTGDPRMNSPWTGLGTPVISLPMGRFGRLPLGLQFAARRGCDSQLLAATSLYEVS